MFRLFLAVLCITPAAAQHRSANDALLSDVLYGMGVDPEGPVWDTIAGAYDAIYETGSYDRHSLQPLQARGVAYLAVLIAAGEASDARPSRPSIVPTRRDARRLAATALALAPTTSGGALDGLARVPIIEALAEAAGVASAVSCTYLGQRLGAAASNLRASGYVFASSVETVQSAIARCSD